MGEADPDSGKPAAECRTHDDLRGGDQHAGGLPVVNPLRWIAALTSIGPSSI